MSQIYLFMIFIVKKDFLSSFEYFIENIMIKNSKKGQTIINSGHAHEIVIFYEGTINLFLVKKFHIILLF